MQRLRKNAIKWITVSLICLLLGFLLGKFKQDMLLDSLHLMEVDLQRLTDEKIQLSKKVAVFQAQLMTDEKMIVRLTEENKILNEQINLTTNKLFFYERVLVPEKDASGVKVFSFSIIKNSKSNQWDYELVLMRAQKDRQFLTGYFDLLFSVFVDGQLTTMPLSALSDNAPSEDAELAFKFKYFQTLIGSFVLPTEMSVDEVILQINVTKSQWYKGQEVEQRYEWKSLTINDADELSEFDNEKANNISIDNSTESESQQYD